MPVVNTALIGEDHMSTATASRGNSTVKVLGILTLVAGIIMAIAGAVTWGAVASNLSNERITVAEDASAFGGQKVNSPWTAFAQADIINHHALAATDGKTYAELPGNVIQGTQEPCEKGSSDDCVSNPLRTTAMNGSFLRASLFTSVVAFGVAFFAFGVGIVLGMVGWALIKLAAPVTVEAPVATPVPTTAV